MTEGLQGQIELGQEAKAFLTGKLGSYIIGAADQDKAQAITELLALDAYQFNSLVDLQNEICAIQYRVSLSAQLGEYLQELIIADEQADYTLSNETED